MTAVGCIFASFNIKNILMALLHSIICVFIELTLTIWFKHVGFPYLTLPFCLSTMFFSVFAFRKKQEKIRKKRNNKFNARTMSIRGMPILIDNPTKNNKQIIQNNDKNIFMRADTVGSQQIVRDLNELDNIDKFYNSSDIDEHDKRPRINSNNPSQIELNNTKRGAPQMFDE